ncbi:MAG: hypothetical protein ACI358_01140 [Candidatus Limimorpha sp.]
MERLATIGNDGKAQIKLSSDNYYAYLMSHQPNTQLFVPFALDYKYKSYIGVHILENLGLTMAIAGCTTACVGLIIMLIEGGGAGDIVSACGFLGAPAGLAISLLAGRKPGINPYIYSYKYLSHHNTNEKFSFIPITDNGIKKSEPIPANDMITDNADTDNSETTIVKRNSSTAKRKTLDYAQNIEGTYIGSGSLLHKGNTVESYSSVKIVITRIDKNKVSVNVIESGESFFDSDLRYSIMKTENGYSLTLEGISSAVISISQNGNLTFNHPKVNIDGELYTLSVKAKK